MLIYGRDKELAQWAAEIIGIASFREDARAIGIERKGQIIAAVVYDTFSECDVNMHVASKSRYWLTHEFLAHVFAYPFIQCGKRRVTGIVPAHNSKALRLNQHLGFRSEGYCPLALPYDDVVILGMLRRECVFIPEEYRHD